jgi:hypothetical protein
MQVFCRDVIMSKWGRFILCINKMSRHYTIVSLLKQVSCRSQIKPFYIPLEPIRSFTKPAGVLRHVNHGNIRQALKPHFNRSMPIYYQQQHWTSTVSSTATTKKEERIIYNNWLDHLPAKIAPYAFLTRIDKPIGTWLLFWPCGM